MPHECTTCGRTFPDGSKEMLSGCPDCGGNKFQFHPGGTPSSGRSSTTPATSPTSDSDSPGTSDVDTSSTGNADPHSTSGSTETESDTPTTPPTSTDGSFSFGSASPETGADPTSSDPTPDDPDQDTPDPTESDPGAPPEDHAQASARSTFVSDDELPQHDPGDVPPPEGFDPDLPAGNAESAEPDPSVDRTDAGENSRPESQSPGDSEPADISELREELNDQFESIKIHARGEYELNLMELYDREEHIIALQEDGRYVIDVPGSWREPDADD